MSNMVVYTNILALNGHRNLKSVGTKQSKASQRLSSGKRINSAADDAAGLAISEKMRAQIRGMDQAAINSQDGVSLLQTAEGGMQEIDNMLQRVRELVVQAANDANDYASNDRRKIQDEIDSLIDEIDSLQDRVEFNNKKVINGSAQDKDATELRLQEKIKDYGSTTVSNSKLGKAYNESGLANANFTTIANAGSVTIKFTSLANATALNTALTTSSINNLNSLVESIGQAMEALKGSASTTMQAAYTELSKLKSGIVSYRKVYAEKLLLDKQLLEVGKLPASARSLHLQLGAGANQSILVNIGSVSTAMLNVGDGVGRSYIDVIKEEGSLISGQLDTIDAALNYVTSQRSLLGATQNRLEYTINSLEISSENLTSAESRIRDTDMAKEMMNLTKANVLQQAATSMLAQANQAPQNVLQLLQG